MHIEVLTATYKNSLAQLIQYRMYVLSVMQIFLIVPVCSVVASLAKQSQLY